MTEKLQDIADRLVETLTPALLGQPSTSTTVGGMEVQPLWDVLGEAARSGQLSGFQQQVARERSRLGTGLRDLPPTLLMAAAFAGEIDVVRTLLAAGADVRTRIKRFFGEGNALSLAAGQDRHPIVRLLVEAGADPNALAPPFRPLTIAVEQGRVETASALIELGADPRTRGLSANNTLLMEAADRGYAEIARLLLAAGVDPKTENNLRETALDLACAKGRVEIAQMLVEAGAEIDRPGREGIPPLIVAAVSPYRWRFLQAQGFLDREENIEDIDSRAAQIAQILLAAGADPNRHSPKGKTALLEAATQGSTEIVRALLTGGADVNLSNENDPSCNTPLIAAIERGRLETIRLLLAAGADCTRPNGFGIAPIDLANSKGLTEIVAALQGRGARLDSKTAATTALIGAARSGDLAALQGAIAAGADLDRDDREFPKGGLTALMHAAAAGHGEIASALIAAGADVNRHDARQRPWNKTALIYAVAANQLEIVELLLAAGADPNTSDRLDEPGRTPLIYAAINEHSGIARALLATGANATIKDSQGNTALHYAYSNPEIVPLLLAAGADPFEPGTEGDSPIALASMMGKGDLARLMLQARSSDPDVARQQTSQALDWAAGNGDLALVEALLAAGADPDVRDETGFTPLMSAIARGYPKIVERLVAAGADLSLTDEDGKNALYLAIARGDAGSTLDIARWLHARGATLPEGAETSRLFAEAIPQGESAVRLLLELGADVNASNLEGETPLFFAIECDSPAAIAILIAAGADVNARREDGDTPLLFAIGCGSPVAISMTIAAGADVNLGDGEGETPLLFAVKCGSPAIVEMLIAAGADLTKKGVLALNQAIATGNREIVALLEAAGVRQL